MKYALLILCLSLRLFAGISDSDSGIFGPKYNEILNETKVWQNTQSDLVTLVDYGKSVEGRTLRLVIVMKSMQMKSRPALIMSGSTHGDEYLGIEDKLPAEILKRSHTQGSIKDFLNRGGALVFIPILNPDGYENRVRENSNGKDLNRDWDVEPAHFKGFTQVETKLLSEKLEEFTQAPFNFHYQVTVDYHCCIGAILYPWSYTNNKIPEQDLSQHIRLAEIANQHLNIDHGTSADILGYMPVGTTKDYYYARYNSLTFTFEGRYKEEDKKLEQHLAWWEEMLANLPGARVVPQLSFFRNYLPFFSANAE